ncbi:2Fe-2S iron-sulfur cluster-binding protein [Streptomyces sp. NPDC007851]|uniref:2Fe-2S iron-sulfur cluster-binding protein n=1 Tax=Streptomyces sp. NPDC007851 TaxID=3155008 RepID=UPI0033F952B6
MTGTDTRPTGSTPTVPTTTVTLRVNGRDHTLEVDNRMSLLDTLRERLDLTGTKKGCDHGQCGACTVLVDGRRMNACLLLSVSTASSDITTVEGLADGDRLHPVQRAFLEHDAYQCGYCTPGQICSAVGMLREVADGWPSHATQDVTRSCVLDAAEVRERMSGNLCRCAAYPNIVPAILDAGRVSPAPDTETERAS